VCCTTFLLIGECVLLCRVGCKTTTQSQYSVICLNSHPQCFPLLLYQQGGSVAEWLACWTQTLSGNSLRQTVHTHCASVHQAVQLVVALLRVAWVTAGLAESNGSLLPGLTHVTCRLTAKNRDQLRHPTLGNRVWATFAFLHISSVCHV